MERLWDSFCQISNDHCKNLVANASFFIMDFEGFLMEFYCVTNIFDLHTFDNETTALLKFLETSTEMHFVFFIFSTGKKYYNLTFDYIFKMHSRALY